MANASLFEFDIFLVEVIKPGKVWNRSEVEGRWPNAFKPGHVFATLVPVKDGGSYSNQQCLWPAVVPRPRLPRHFNRVNTHVKTSFIRCLGSFLGLILSLYSDQRYLQDVCTAVDPYQLKLATLWSFTVTEGTRSCSVFWQQKIWQAFHWLYSTSIMKVRVYACFFFFVKRKRNRKFVEGFQGSFDSKVARN